MDTGIIGAGPIGAGLAAHLVKLGHTVSIANSRGPASLLQVAANTGAAAATVPEAIREKQLIIVTIPQKNIPDLPKEMFRQLPADTVVIDTCNYYPLLRDGVIPALEESGLDSLWVQEQLGVPVVKVFNSIFAESLHDKGLPAGDKNRIALSVSGDKAAAKKIVLHLVEAIGFDAVDIGSIADSWKQQPGSSIYCRDITLPVLEERLAAMATTGRAEATAQRKADEALMNTDMAAYLRKMRG
ncbi:NADPH-dependent F420 reductase [Chitinophaga eiseniae]|uniref:NAD(P)-binding domain-containing protein n=1 Tax=Chitinophaga eiseniae TaxID=634771 RepID=A0A847SLR7_9BACT|nr:NAD(P)-binding domain-containing protein [Chitinophaga eiseniae]NLR82911.1 NAD(P)-binding domain-containing protein [Chitinophaga eiseniae]